MSVSSFTHIFALLVGAIGAVSDARTQTIPMYLVAAWLLIAATHFSAQHLLTTIMLCLLSLLIYLYQKIRHQNLIGVADLIILPSIAPYIITDEIPQVLIFTGCFGALYCACFKAHTSPFLTCLFLATMCNIIIVSILK